MSTLLTFNTYQAMFLKEKENRKGYINSNGFFSVWNPNIFPFFINYIYHYMLFSHNLSFFQVGWDRAVYQDVPACLGNQATWDCQARNGVK